MKNRRGRWLPLILILLGLAPRPLAAFGPETHIWITQQVLNDVLPDGKIMTPLGEFPVDPAIVTTLKNHQEEYRMGGIGPDGFPDILAGQMVVHPGLKNGWQSDDWLQWMMNDANASQEGLAFALGYLNHAASDVFAHSYINNYAGDVFLLTDGEQEVEARHTAVEKYIDLRLPPITDASGKFLGDYVGLLKTPIDFIRESLFMNETVMAQYSQSPLTAHLVAMYRVRKALHDAISLADALESWLKNNVPGFAPLEDILAEKSALETKIAEWQKTANDWSGQVTSLQGEIAKQNMLLNSPLGPVGQLKILNNSIEQHKKALALLVKYLPNPTEVCTYKPCLTPPFFLCKWKCTSIPGLSKIINPQWKKLNDELGKLLAQKDPLQKAIDKITGTIEILEGKLAEAAKVLDDIKGKMEGAGLELIKLTNLATNSPFGPLGAIKLTLLDWQNSVDQAITQYLKTSEKIQQQLLTDKGKPMQPIRAWMNCWSPAFMPIPKEIVTDHCAAIHSLADLNNKVEELKNDLGPIYSVINPAGALQDIIHDQLQELLEEAAKDITYSLAGDDLAAFLKLWDQDLPVTTASLNQLFSMDQSGKNLLIIPDASKRLDAEMHLNKSGYFDPKSFRVVANAIMLAKLSLLDADTLNDLTKKAGVTGKTIYGPTLYPKNKTNILFDWIKSMDGNQQWLEYGLPKPHQNFSGAKDYDNLLTTQNNQYPYNQYGYGFFNNNSHGGFPLWQDPEAREKIFKVLFQGPIGPGVDDPSEFGFSDLVGDYPYRACHKNPFPNTMDGTTHNFLKDKAGEFGDDGCD